MPHLRKRHAQDLLRHIARFSPLMGLLGHRQVGKTTLLESFTERYYSLDQGTELEEARSHPASYLKKRQNKQVAIDECQLAPELFPALKEIVRKNKAPGQFILSGSVRFTSRRAIRESLTGRIINTELYPLVLSELEEESLPSVVVNALRSETLEPILRKPPLRKESLLRKTKLISTYFQQGGLPGICFIREARLRELKLDEQLRTLLDRDLRLIHRTPMPYAELKRLCTSLADSQGVPLEFVALQRRTGISVPTIKKMIYALEAIFLIRVQQVEGGRKGPLIFFEDMAEASWLRSKGASVAENITHFCFTHFRAQFDYSMGDRAETFHYLTRGGAHVPLAYRGKSGILGIISLENANEASRFIASANSFLKTYGNSRVIMVHLGSEREMIQPRVAVLPLAELV